jgi:streptomycin 6-kinase
MELPPAFLSTIRNGFGQEGEKFLATLPESISEASARWNLTEVEPVPMLSYNFVAFARFPSPIRAECFANEAGGEVRGGGSEVVLKMGVPDFEMESQIAALKLFNGEGACKLLDYDEERCWMLLERLKPGVMLSTLADDEEATHIAADVMQKIRRPPSDDDLFIRLSDWFNDGLKGMRKMFEGGTGPLDAKLVERVERSVKDFFAENHQPVLMHGDFHHFNILSSERGWLIIDPKGVIGPACYEVGPLLMNPWGDLFSGKDYRRMTKRRIDILHERLGFERERIREWGLAHAILSAWWSIEDHGDWRYAADVAAMIASLDMK